MGIKIESTGKAVPGFTVDNKQMETLIDTSDQWIVERTGIRERRIAREESGLDLASAAAAEALEGIPPGQVDLVIVATVTPDAIVPSMASLLKKELGLVNAAVFDINSACSGFLYGLWIAEALMKSGAASGGRSNSVGAALVVGVERLSRITNWKDRNTCILFGDGAGAALLRQGGEEEGILASFVKNYDDNDKTLACGMEYVSTPFDPPGEDIPEGERLIRNQTVRMSGTKVFRFAVGAVTEVMEETLKRAGLSADDIDHYIPHQANFRIIQAAANRFHQPIEKFQVNIGETGNVSAASVPMAMHDAYRTGKIRPGQLIMLVGFGGGLSAGAVIYRA